MPRALVDDDPRGALRLEGQVVDAEDRGVAGATVVLGSNPPRTATTEADGGFAFEGLVGRPYTLAARSPHGVAGPVTARLTAKSDPVVLRLRPGARLTVTVVGGDGKAIDGATVELRGVDEQRATVKGHAAVFAPVVPGGYQLAAWAPGKARAFQWIQITAGDSEARIALAAGAPVRGRVVDEAGAGVAGAQVRFGGASDWTQQASARHDAVTSDGDGGFAFEALPAGSFRFHASHPERAPGSSPLITLDGKTARDGVIIALAVGAVVRGRVVDAAHHPVTAARVRIGGAGRPNGEPPRQAYSDADGQFELRGLPRKALSVVALHELGASQVVAIDTSAGDVAGVTLTLDVTGTIAGIVVDGDGQPVEGAQVVAGPVFGERAGGAEWRLRGFPEERSDAAGRFVLTGLAAGSYRVSAAPAHAARGRGNPRDAVTASVGDKNVRLVVQPDGGVRGKVAFTDGTAPGPFTVVAGTAQQSYLAGDGGFTLDGVAPGQVSLEVRGPGFASRTIAITVAPGQTTDAGTIAVERGRTIAGVVVAEGQPVPDATVYAGRVVLGNGTSSGTQQVGNVALQPGTRSTTTDAAGAFSLAGFGDGDVTLVAEQAEVGRSRALRLPTVMPGQTELTITLEKFGALSGTLRQAGKPADGVIVTCQSTSTPGAIFSVAAGADGGYRLDRLAPDVYKVSAMLGDPRSGLRSYSKQIEVPAGREVTLDLAVDPGTVTLTLALTAPGTVGAATTLMTTGAVAAATSSELSLKLAAAGAGASTRVFVLAGEPARFTQLTPGAYTACVVPLPLEIRPIAARGYVERHGDALAAFCRPVTVAPAPDAQRAEIAITVPAVIADGSGH